MIYIYIYIYIYIKKAKWRGVFTVIVDTDHCRLWQWNFIITKAK
jgi:hypothetical protein